MINDPNGLNVWCGHSLVGYLWNDSTDRMGFSYDSDWIKSGGGFQLSISLPLQVEEFSPESGIAHRYFANLLPEGGARDELVRDLKVANSDFVLLRAIGGECAGALSLLRAEDSPATSSTYEEMTENSLGELVMRKGQPTTWTGNNRPRLSLAGAQNKCPVLFTNNTYFLPKKESPSSHILKFEIKGYRHLPAYETFTTLVARKIGLPVVDITLEYAQKNPFARILRYDRVLNESGQIERYHQEDFCQALGIGHQRKYESDGGATFAECYQLLSANSSSPAIDLEVLLRWQIFNVLAGNSDGHAKNLSLLYLPGGEVRLAPLYDLICTRAIDRINEDIALSVGGEKNPSLITLDHWAGLAKDCGIRPTYLLSVVRRIATDLIAAIKPARVEFENRYGTYESLQRIEQVITTQCRRVLKS